MRVLILLCVVAGAALVYLMSVASSNNELFAKNYSLLMYLGGGLALGLMGLIVYQLMVLRRKLRERVFGSKLTLRLMVVFALMALIPGGLVYASRSTEDSASGSACCRIRSRSSRKKARPWRRRSPSRRRARPPCSTGCGSSTRSRR